MYLMSSLTNFEKECADNNRLFSFILNALKLDQNILGDIRLTQYCSQVWKDSRDFRIILLNRGSVFILWETVRVVSLLDLYVFNE